MSDLYALLVGYISGFITGIFIVLLIIGYLYISETDAEYPNMISELLQDITKIYEYNENLFLIAFIFGFLSGLGSLTKTT